MAPTFPNTYTYLPTGSLRLGALVPGAGMPLPTNGSRSRCQYSDQGCSLWISGSFVYCGDGDLDPPVPKPRDVHPGHPPAPWISWALSSRARRQSSRAVRWGVPGPLSPRVDRRGSPFLSALFAAFLANTSALPSTLTRPGQAYEFVLAFSVWSRRAGPSPLRSASARRRAVGVSPRIVSRSVLSPSPPLPLPPFSPARVARSSLRCMGM
jgi:hypothetical protein